VKMPGVGEPPVPRGTSSEPTVTQKQLSAGSTSADDVAANAGKGTATAAQDTVGTVKPPAGGDAPTTNARTGTTGDIANSDTVKPKASSGGDAADTMRMKKVGSGEGSKPSDATNVSGNKTGEITREIPAGSDTAKMQKAGGTEAPKAESSASNPSGSAAGAKGGAGNAVPTKSVDQIVDAYIQKRTPGEIKNSVSEGDIARMKERFKSELQKSGQDPKIADEISKEQYRRMAMADEVYHHYNRPAPGKPQPTITEAQLNDQLKKYDGPTESPGGWHVRMNKSAPGTTADHSWVNADKAHPVDRFYVNVKAEHAPEFADYVSGELNKKGIKFQLKVASEIEGYARADSGLVYTQGKDFEAVRDVISKYRDLHPEAIAEGSPAFTKPMGKGISVAEEPLQEGLPVAYHGGHSFGTARANLIAEAINQAPANASPAQVKVLVRAKLQSAGFDPDRPWLAQGSRTDRLNVGDANIARSNASNGGMGFDDTMPPPAGQGTPAGNNGAAAGPSNGPGATGASSADIADQVAARQHAEQVQNYKGPNFKADPSQGGSVAIDSLLDDMQKGNLKVADNAFNGKFHDQIWHDLTGKEGQAPAAYKIGNSARVDLNRLTPDQLQRYKAYVQQQDAAKGPH
jgi:HopA1 effector protein family